MTLIAAVGLDTYPVIFGDLLVSAPGFDQKVVLLGDHCVIAWTGNTAFARTVVDELRTMASEAPLSIAIIETYLSKLDPELKDQVSFVGWVRESEVFRQFWYRADIAESAMFGRISAGGSAATDFVKLASQISEGPANVQGEMPNSLERAITSMISATSLLLRAELSGPSNVLQHFGRGHEIATFVRDKFEKVGDIAFVSWVADVYDGKVTLSGPQFILKQDYAGELLLLHALSVHPGRASKDPPVIEEARYVIPPFGGNVDAEEATGISWPGMAATFTCHVVFVRSSKDFAVVNQIEYSPSREPASIRFTLGDDHAPFGVSQRFCEELTQSIHADFADR
jgi:hypothetical protein